jgi:hypothetical protein
MRPLSQPLRLIIKRNVISFINDRHSDMRHSSGFESPLSKRFGGNFIKHRITGALSHDCISHFAAPSIDSHEANTASSDIGALGLVRILGGALTAMAWAASTTPVHRMAKVPRWTRIRKSPSHVRKVKLPPLFGGSRLNLPRKRKSDVCWAVANLFASLCFR